MSTGTLSAAAAGLLLGASFLDFRLFALAWIGMALLVAVVHQQDPRRAFTLGFVTGMVGLTLAFAWLVYALRVFGGFSTGVAVLLSLVPIACMALQFGAFGAGLAWLGPLPFGLAAPLVFTAIEFLFPSLFPWRLANSQYRVPTLLQTGELAGPFLLTFAMVWLGSCGVDALGIARSAGPPGWRRAAARLAPPVVLVLALVGYGQWRIGMIERTRATAPALRVGIVQGNVGVNRKGRQALFTRNLDDYRRLSREIVGESDLLIWPETVFQRHIPTTLATLGAGLHPFPDAPRPLIFGGIGAAHRGRDRHLFNSAFLVGENGVIAGRYDKRVLVPFGEYMPLGDRFPSLRALSPATGNFRPGTGPVVLELDTRARIGTLICYEDVVPHLARVAVQAGATLLLNLTNDAWYGDSAEPHQHQALAIWRAVETRRDMVRVTNTGVTSVIAATGSVVIEFPTFEPYAQAVDVRILDGRTFYVVYGDVFGWSVVGMLVLVAVRRWRAGAVLPCKPPEPA